MGRMHVSRPALADVRTALQELGEAKSDRVAEATGYSQGFVQAALRELVDRGEVTYEEERTGGQPAHRYRPREAISGE